MAFKARSCDVRFLSDALRHISTTQQRRVKKLSGAIFLFRKEILNRMEQIAPVKRRRITYALSDRLPESGPSRRSARDIEEIDGHQQHQSFN